MLGASRAGLRTTGAGAEGGEGERCAGLRTVGEAAGEVTREAGDGGVCLGR